MGATVELGKRNNIIRLVTEKRHLAALLRTVCGGDKGSSRETS